MFTTYAPLTITVISLIAIFVVYREVLKYVKHNQIYKLYEMFKERRVKDTLRNLHFNEIVEIKLKTKNCLNITSIRLYNTYSPYHWFCYTCEENGTFNPLYKLSYMELKKVVEAVSNEI